MPFKPGTGTGNFAHREMVSKALALYSTRLGEIISALERNEMTAEEACSCIEWLSASLRGTVKWLRTQIPPYS